MITKRVLQYCSDILQNSKCRELPFHNLTHTQEVVDNVLNIANKMERETNEIEILVISSSFHDIGYSETYNNHEEFSKKIAFKYLTEAHYPKEKIEIVLSCIDATKTPQKPSNILGEILCDADLFHIGSPNFLFRNLLLKEEWEMFCDLKVTEPEWLKNNIKFLDEHRFKTNYGKEFLERGKQENLHKLKQLFKYSYV